MMSVISRTHYAPKRIDAPIETGIPNVNNQTKSLMQKLVAQRFIFPRSCLLKFLVRDRSQGRH